MTSIFGQPGNLPFLGRNGRYIPFLGSAKSHKTSSVAQNCNIPILSRNGCNIPNLGHNDCYIPILNRNCINMSPRPRPRVSKKRFLYIYIYIYIHIYIYIYIYIYIHIYIYIYTGADLGFFRGGGGFSKILMTFPSSSKALKSPCFGQQKAVFRQFMKKVDKKIAFFFGARSPSKLVYIGAEGAVRKILGSVGKK